jgi:pimeloyl-ACP methyl ester carboxylesterase
MESARALLDRAQRGSLHLPGRGVEIAILDWGGDGPLALLHHATGFCKGMWGRVAASLAPRFRVIAMDARGHGDSSKLEGSDAYAWDEFAHDAQAVAERLQTLHGRRVELGMGHSFGGTSLLGAAAARPDLFGRLVLLDPVAHPPAPTELSVGRQNDLSEGARRRRSEWPSREAARDAWAPRSVFKDWQPESLDLYALDGLRERVDGSVTLKCPPTVEAAIFSQGKRVDVAAFARGNRVPTLWLWGARGHFPRATYEALAATMREARVEDIDAGHLLLMERPDLVVEAALRFVERG